MESHAYNLKMAIKCTRKIVGFSLKRNNRLKFIVMLLLLPALIYINHLEIQNISYLEDVFKRRNGSTMETYIQNSLAIFTLQAAITSFFDYSFSLIFATSLRHALSDYIRLPFDSFKNFTLGDLVNRQYEKGEAASCVLYTVMFNVIEYLFKIASTLYELKKKGNRYLVGGLAAGVLVHFAAFFIFSREYNFYQRHYLKAKIHACTMVESESANFDVIKTFDLGGKSVERVSGAMEHRRSKKIAFDVFRHKTGLAYKSFEIFCIVFFYSFYYRDMLEVADLSGMIKQITNLYESLRELLKNLGEANSFFFTFYTLESALERPKEAMAPLGRVDEIRATGLSCPNVFSGVDMTISRNERVAVVGRNGAGKTTLLRALSGLSGYGGEIRINGTPLDSICRRDLYKNVTVVSQSDSYTAGSIMKNLQYGNGLSRDEVIEKCKEFGVDDVFSSLENGYDKLSGPCGKELSGGQKQRVSFMRGVLRNTPVLIMDDCLSGVNTHSRLGLLNKLLESNNRTLIMTTYNFDLLPKFDKILLLDGTNSKFGSFGSLKEDIKRHIIKSSRASL